MKHLTAHDVDRFRRGELAADALLALSRHLSACRECSAMARDRVDADDAATSIRAAIGIDEDVPRNRTRLLLIAAAVALVVIGAAILRMRVEPTPNRPPRIATTTMHPNETRGYGREDWDSWVAAARRSGSVSMPPLLRELRPPADAWRGTSHDGSPRLHPAGAVIESQTPRFAWSATPGARYIVRVFDDNDEIARSPKIAVVTWSPKRPLRRGVTYAWQVEVVGRNLVIPSPPAPPALFHIVDEKTASGIAEARRRFPSDHLLLGILYARAGMQDLAEQELALAPNDPAAVKLVASIRAW